jgi:hypothetical protein
VLGPATAHSILMTPASVGLAYVNPPFDDEMGGGRREEQGFVEVVTRWLAPRGVLVLIIPVTALNHGRSFVDYIDCHYREMGIWRFPDECRRYNEIVLIAIKRSVPLAEANLESCLLNKLELRWRSVRPEQFPQLGEAQPKEWYAGGGCSIDREPEVRTYKVPAAFPVTRFTKTGYTEGELEDAVIHSPLSRLFEPKPAERLRRPPLPLGSVHVGMVIASGLLDGPLYVPGHPELDHVTRGVSVKEEFYNEEASGPQGEPDEETGEVRWRDVYSERITTTVRAVDRNGKIHDFKEEVITGERVVEEMKKETTRNPDGYPEGYDFELAAKLARITVQNGATPAEEEQAQARLKAMKEGRTYHSSDEGEEAA